MPGIVQSGYDIMILLFSHSPSVIKPSQTMGAVRGIRKVESLWCGIAAVRFVFANRHQQRRNVDVY